LRERKLAMKTDTSDETEHTLDHAKLLGFRALAQVTTRETDLGESADLAFQKRGSEGSALN
jgi:hypothetical protein